MTNHQTLREQYYHKYLEAYNQLNANQKKAVEAIDGPVMAIAGPGTGKTQLLALRVCNILLQTDMSASNILCLTFTDAGAYAMRQRLLTFMGPDAYHVAIYTYHSFCNMIIRENPQEFSEHRELQNISDLETVELLMQLIDEIPLEHPIKRLKGDTYNDLGRFRNLFSTMKQEDWTEQYILDKIEEYNQIILEDENFKYKVNRGANKKGEVNMRLVNDEMAKFEKIKHAAPLIEQYNKMLHDKGRIDFNDSIINVIRKLEENQDLLYWYQERYQYILADEYQDTNGSQNKLLFLLATYDDRPNLFVVGDDDQAIYRFQGANMNNVLDFKKLYNPEQIVLDQNYRSNQFILDDAMKLISNNVERLSNKYAELSKELKSAKLGIGGGPTQILTFETIQAQEIGVIAQIQALHSDGVAYNEIAIIYRSHAEIENIVKYFAFNDVPLNLKKKVDLLKLKEVTRLVTILKYINGEYKAKDSMQSELFEILHYDFFKLRANDIGQLAIHCSRATDEENDDRSWRNVLTNMDLLAKVGINEERVNNMYEVNMILERLIADIPNVTLQVLFEKITTSTGLLSDVLTDADKTWRIQVINSFFNFIKEETAKNDKLDISSLLSMLEKMESYNITMPLNKIISSNDGIHLMTAHGAKGLEFDHVFIINAYANNWIKKNRGNGSFSTPATLLAASDVSDIEDDRRLFYVAMTRAKKNLYITLPKKDGQDKALESLVFLTEIGYDSENAKVEMIDESLMVEYGASLMRYEQGKANLIDKSLIDSVLESLYMNATGVSKYLKCPITYYFDNILRVPMARTANMGYGNAIHFALENYFQDINKSPNRTLPPADKLTFWFKLGMERFKSHFTSDEYKSHLYNGEQTLAKYYENYHGLWSTPIDFKLEYRIKSHFDGILISGVIDKLEVYHDHVEVYDYKTGAYKSDRLKPAIHEDLGGDYWRQVVFYEILLDADAGKNWRMTKAYMDFVEPSKDDKFKKVPFEIAEFEKDIVKSQIRQVYSDIKQYKFEEGCNESTCKWCNFVKQNMPLQSPLAGGESEDTEYSEGV